MTAGATRDVTSATVSASPRSWPARSAAIALVRLYQQLRGTRPSPCRFVPSCSDYAVESLERHGFAEAPGSPSAAWCRCRPFGGYGADPVPD